MFIRLNLCNATYVFRQTGPDVEFGAALAGAGFRQAERGADPSRAVWSRLEVKDKRTARSLFRLGKHSYNALNSFPSKRPLEIRMKKKKRFVPSHFGRPLGGFMGLGIPPLPPAAKQGEGVRAIREQTNKVIEGLRKVRGSDSR